ncbi:universal stress protein [Rhizobium sp. HT1-10]|uniref:universal stress protein n=1 Tax=Rhizobium sp. HT1-10 TaxID=3111638 RepID=UPI003C18013F
MYRKIIVAIDMAALEKAEPALRRAASLLETGGEIIVLNVVEDLTAALIIDLPQDYVAEAIDDARGKLKELCERLEIAAVIEIRAGSPAATILKTAAEAAADLIIVSSHVPDLSNYFLGATADRVVRHAKCSVLVERK